MVRAIEEAWDSGAVDQLDQHFSDDFDNSQSGVPGLPPGLARTLVAAQATEFYSGAPQGGMKSSSSTPSASATLVM